MIVRSYRRQFATLEKLIYGLDRYSVLLRVRFRGPCAVSEMELVPVRCDCLAILSALSKFHSQGRFVDITVRSGDRLFNCEVLYATLIRRALRYGSYCLL